MKFKDEATEDVFNGKATKAARARIPGLLAAVARRKLDLVVAAATLDALRFPPGNRLEALKGDRTGQHSVRINDRYRLCFIWVNGEAQEIEIVDYH